MERALARQAPGMTADIEAKGAPLPLSGTPSDHILNVLLKAPVLILCLALSVNGALYQLQMLATGNAAPIPGVVTKIGLFGILSIAFLRGAYIRSSLAAPTLLFVAYLTIHMVYVHFLIGTPFADILQSYNAYYFGFILAALATIVPLAIPYRYVVAAVVIVFIVCAGLGLAQQITQRPLLPTESSDGNFKVLVWQSATRIRAFSLFIAPGQFALFSAFVAALSTALLLQSRNVIVKAACLVLLMLASACSFVAATRSEFISLICATVTAYILASKRWAFSRYLPFLWLMVSVGIAVLALLHLESHGMTFGIDDASTFGDRLYEWKYFSGELRSSSALQILLGLGLVQNSKAQVAEAALPIDNLFLALVLHVGVIGTGLFVALLWKWWDECRKNAQRTRSSMAIAAAAICSTVFGVGLFSTNFVMIPGLLLLAVITDTRRST